MEKINYFFKSLYGSIFRAFAMISRGFRLGRVEFIFSEKKTGKTHWKA